MAMMLAVVIAVAVAVAVRGSCCSNYPKGGSRGDPFFQAQSWLGAGLQRFKPLIISGEMPQRDFVAITDVRRCRFEGRFL